LRPRCAGACRDGTGGRGRWDKTVVGLAVALEIVDTGRPPNDLEAILAGSACHVPVGPGDVVVAEIDGLGTVAATIAP